MCSYAAPVFEGFPLRYAITESPMTGEALSDVLQRQLTRVGYSFTTPLERDLLDKIKVSSRRHRFYQRTKTVIFFFICAKSL